MSALTPRPPAVATIVRGRVAYVPFRRVPVERARDIPEERL